MLKQIEKNNHNLEQNIVGAHFAGILFLMFLFHKTQNYKEYKKLLQ